MNGTSLSEFSLKRFRRKAGRCTVIACEKTTVPDQLSTHRLCHSADSKQRYVAAFCKARQRLKTLRMIMIAYNLLKQQMQQAAREAGKPLHEMSFKGTLDYMTEQHEAGA